MKDRKPHQERTERAADIHKQLSSQNFMISDLATISRDNYNQFFFRFPSKIAEMLELKPNYTLEIIITKPLGSAINEKTDLFQCRIIRKPKKEARKEFR